jgi:hypothetical protein
MGLYELNKPFYYLLRIFFNIIHFEWKGMNYLFNTQIMACFRVWFIFSLAFDELKNHSKSTKKKKKNTLQSSFNKLSNCWSKREMQFFFFFFIFFMEIVSKLKSSLVLSSWQIRTIISNFENLSLELCSSDK